MGSWKHGAAGLILLALGLAACQPQQPAGPRGQAAPAAQAPAAASAGPSRVAVGINLHLASQDPHAHSDIFLYPFWCEVLGCLVGWNAAAGEPAPALAERWEVENPTTWVFHLRRDVRWHDGSPFTSADVIATLERVQDHPLGRQKHRLRNVASFEAPDDYTVKIVTRQPNAQLLDETFVQGIAVTSKAQLERGDDLATVAPLGTGPYRFKEWVQDQRVVVAKVSDWWGGPVHGPDEVVYRLMRESQARIAGLLNGEIQIAQDIPYQDAERLSNQPNLRLVPAESLTLMFLGMNQAFPPWDNKLLRQAVAYAIDRDAIIQSVLLGYATPLDGAVGPGQFGYDPAVQPRYRYDPERARQLVAQAGFPNGVDVELTTPVGTFPKDKEAAEAIAPMLTAVGIRTKLAMPESSTRWANVQAGKVAFFYQARGSLRDLGNFNEYFETGVTKRINYSDPRVDALWAQARASFDPGARQRVLSELQSMLLEDVPVHFLWRNKVLWGVANSVDWTPRTDETMLASEIRVR